MSINGNIIFVLEHAVCKDQNGQCSKLCLPRETNQRSCSCRDGVNLKDDGRTCVGGMSHIFICQQISAFSCKSPVVVL